VVGDGKYLYFTVEETVQAPAATPDPFAYTTQTSRIDRVDVSSGARSTWVGDAQQAGPGAGGKIAYLQMIFSQDSAEYGVSRMQLMISDAEGKERAVLVEQTKFQGIYAPHLSPDGKWVVFAAVNVPPAAPAEGFDLFRWLEPQTAQAHGFPWDVYLVPTSGGEPLRLTQMDEDEPFPIWLDNETVAFMGTTGLYKLRIDSSGQAIGEPTLFHAGSPHGRLSWHAP
jgi:hypothetical protein